jgi:anti-sigma factor RsiW
MTCPTREELVAALDGDLSPDGLAARRHADGCDRCRADLARLEAGIAALRAGSPAVEPSPFFATRLAARLAAAPPRRRGPSFYLGTPWRLAAAAGLAAAALVAGVTVLEVRGRNTRAAELAVAERLDLYEDLEVVASVGDVDGPDDVAVIAALDGRDGREGRP